MDLLLVNSPLFDGEEVKGQPDVPPLGLGYIATQAKKEGFKVSLVDAVSEHLTCAQILEKVVASGPRWFGINIFSTNVSIVRKIVENVPSHISVMIGGQAAGYLTGEIREWNGAERIMVVVGDGELAVPAILGGKLQGNLVNTPLRTVVVDQLSVYYPEDIDDLSIDRSFFAHEPLSDGDLLECHIVTTRGCPHNCAFCGSARDTALYKKIRARTQASILSELAYICAVRPETNCIRVLDDLFLSTPHRVDTAIEIFADTRFQWRAMAHLEPLSRCTDTQFKAMKASGCRELFVGIESGNEQMRATIGKGGSVDIIAPTTSRLLGAGIDVKGYFILGLPGETRHQMEDTIELARELYNLPGPGRFHASAFTFRPYHGTKFYDQILASFGVVNAIAYDHRIASEGRERFSFSGGHYADASPEEVHELMMELTKLGKGAK